jgi:hypothetical protein
MIPTLIFVGLLVGLATRRSWLLLSAIPVLGIAWASVVAGINGAHFLGGFAFGVANAAVGIVFGAGLRAIAEGVTGGFRPRGGAR